MVGNGFKNPLINNITVNNEQLDIFNERPEILNFELLSIFIFPLINLLTYLKKHLLQFSYGMIKIENISNALREMYKKSVLVLRIGIVEIFLRHHFKAYLTYLYVTGSVHRWRWCKIKLWRITSLKQRWRPLYFIFTNYCTRAGYIVVFQMIMQVYLYMSNSKMIKA